MNSVSTPTTGPSESTHAPSSSSVAISADPFTGLDSLNAAKGSHSSQLSMPYCHHHSSGWGAPASVPPPNCIDIILAHDVEPDAYLSACFDCGTSSTFRAPVQTPTSACPV